MKAVVVLLAVLVAAGLLFFARFGVRPFRTPYEHVEVDSSATGFWVEFAEESGRPALVRGTWGNAQAIPSFNGFDYAGESGVLFLLHPPGLDRRFLVLRAVLGAYTMRFTVWEVLRFRVLRRVAEFSSAGESSDSDFVDVDGDGLEELTAAHRRWVSDDRGLLDNWAIRTDYLSWTGERFEHRWSQLTVQARSGLLVSPEDPGAEDPQAAGICRDELEGLDP